MGEWGGGRVGDRGGKREGLELNIGPRRRREGLPAGGEGGGPEAARERGEKKGRGK